MALLCVCRSRCIFNYFSRLTAGVLLFSISSISNAATISAIKTINSDATVGTCENSAGLANNGSVTFTQCQNFKLNVLKSAKPSMSNYYISDIITSSAPFKFTSYYVNSSGSAVGFSISSFTPSLSSYTYSCGSGYQLSDAAGIFTESGQYCTTNTCTAGTQMSLWSPTSTVNENKCYAGCVFKPAAISIQFPEKIYSDSVYVETATACSASNDVVDQSVAESANAAAAAEAARQALIDTATASCGAGNFSIYTENVGGVDTLTYYCFTSEDDPTDTTSGATGTGDTTSGAAGTGDTTSGAAGTGDTTSGATGTVDTASGSTGTGGDTGSTGTDSGSTGSGSTAASDSSSSGSLTLKIDDESSSVGASSINDVEKSSFDIRNYFSFNNTFLPRSCPSFEYLKFSLPAEFGGKTYDLSSNMPRLCDFLTDLMAPLSQILAVLLFIKMTFVRRD